MIHIAWAGNSVLLIEPFIGVPASGKTLFLEWIMELRKDAVYFNATNTTNRILDVLEEKRPKIILSPTDLFCSEIKPV